MQRLQAPMLLLQFPVYHYHMSEESYTSTGQKLPRLPIFLSSFITSAADRIQSVHGAVRPHAENERVAGVKCSSDPAQDILRFKLAGGKGFHRI